MQVFQNNNRILRSLIFQNKIFNVQLPMTKLFVILLLKLQLIDIYTYIYVNTHFRNLQKSTFSLHHTIAHMYKDKKNMQNKFSSNFKYSVVDCGEWPAQKMQTFNMRHKLII